MIIGRDKTEKSGDSAPAPPETIHDLMPAAEQPPAAPASYAQTVTPVGRGFLAGFIINLATAGQATPSRRP